MRVTDVYLNNYRNYRDSHIALDGKNAVLCGKNATGKTNFVESLYYCALGRSPRGVKDKELILFGETSAYIRVRVQKRYGAGTIEILLDRGGKKRILVNSLPITKLSELYGMLAVVYFSPDEMRLVKGSPDERRRYMDISLTQQSRAYLYNLNRYNDCLRQRNNLLKSDISRADKLRALPLWDGQLAESGVLIVNARRVFAERLQTEINPIHSRLTDDAENLRVCYETTDLGGTGEGFLDKMVQKLADNRDKDLMLGYTTVGPHRDDLAIYLNDLDARKFGSQGQQRSAVLSLKLAEIRLLSTSCGEPPILLLDDVLSELDDRRTAQLLEATADVQTILTCTAYTVSDTRPTVSTGGIVTDSGEIQISLR